ncbi:MAG: hypothetical protein R3Y12_08480 [Clostridia bacterium]
MENEFLIRKTKNPNMITGWEFERNKFNEIYEKINDETKKLMMKRKKDLKSRLKSEKIYCIR